VLFAHRGGRAHAPENTLEAFALGLRLGATGLESDAWLTSDGVIVLDHDGYVRSGLRRRPIPRTARRELPAHIPTLAALYDACGTGFELSLDVKDVAAFDEIVAVARAAGGDALSHLWLCHPDLDVLVDWRSRCGEVRLVNSTRLARLPRGPERRAAELAAGAIDAVNLHHSDWTGGLTTLFHRFERVAFGWDAQHERVVQGLLHMGIDGVFSDWVDRMVDAYRSHRPS
jgi:glycerophosphoryl diester phosphodiesterase